MCAPTNPPPSSEPLTWSHHQQASDHERHLLAGTVARDLLEQAKRWIKKLHVESLPTYGYRDPDLEYLQWLLKEFILQIRNANIGFDRLKFVVQRLWDNLEMSKMSSMQKDGAYFDWHYGEVIMEGLTEFLQENEDRLLFQPKEAQPVPNWSGTVPEDPEEPSPEAKAEMMRQLAEWQELQRRRGAWQPVP